MYLITFDKSGRCQSPLTLAQLLEDVNKGNFTDVHVFSHGWNNVFKDAVGLYREFFGRYFSLRDARGLNDPARYRPLVVGIIWPSTLLVSPWEAAPRIAGLASGPERDETVGADQDALRELAGEVRPSDVGRLYELAERGPTLVPGEARELAAILLPIYQESAHGAAEIEGDAATGIDANYLLALWRRISPDSPAALAVAGFAPDRREQAPAQPLAAGGILSWLDPRGPIRVSSVLQMKDRAGVVGTKGVGPELVHRLLNFKTSRIHLIGHSYGAKVILSALCCQPHANPAASLLLLEPAVSYLCFGQNIDGRGRRGGYRDALERVGQPILSTFSSRDVPLRRLFHLAVVRDSDWGEQKIAGMPPSKFAALGGFGPGGLNEGESKTLEMLSPDDPAPGNQYPRGDPKIKIYGVDGSNGQIKGHGDVATAFTAWAHLNLVEK